MITSLHHSKWWCHLLSIQYHLIRMRSGILCVWSKDEQKSWALYACQMYAWTNNFILSYHLLYVWIKDIVYKIFVSSKKWMHLRSLWNISSSIIALCYNIKWIWRYYDSRLGNKIFWVIEKFLRILSMVLENKCY